MIDNVTTRHLHQLKGTNLHTILYGKEGDISNLCQFYWCTWVYYRATDANAGFPFPILDLRESAWSS